MAEEKIPNNIDECFLLDFMSDIATFRDISNLEKQSEHVVILDDKHSGDSKLFLNQLIDPEYQSLMDACPKNLFQSLSPMVNLYKVFYDPTDTTKEEIKSVKFQFGKFDPLKAKQAIRELRTSYGDDAALYGGFRPGHLAPSITEANIVFDGQNPAEASAFVKVNLKLYFPSSDALFFKKNIAGQEMSFANLIERPTVPKAQNAQLMLEDNHRVYSQDNFRIKMELFYLPKDSTFLNDDKVWGKDFPLNRRRAIMELISNNRLTLFLNIVKHEFSFDHDNVNLPFYLDVQYIGALESAMNTKHADILKDPEYDRKMGEIMKTEEYRNYQLAKLASDSLGLQNLTKAGVNIDTVSHRNVKARGLPNEVSEFVITPEMVERYQITLLADPGKTYGGEPAFDRHHSIVDIPDLAAGYEERKLSKDAMDNLKGAIKSESKAWAQVGVEWSVRKSLALQNYGETKRAYDKLLKDRGMLEDQQRSRSYSRIIEQLYGRVGKGESATFGSASNLSEKEKSDLKRASNPYVYTVEVPSGDLRDYVNRRGSRTLDKETEKSLKELEKNGDTAAADELRRQRESIQNDTRSFYKHFWKKINPQLLKAERDITLVEGSEHEGIFGDDEGYTKTSQTTGKEYTAMQAISTADILRQIAKKQIEGGKTDELHKLLKKSTDRAIAPEKLTGTYAINYFFLGDLIDIVLKTVHQSNSKHHLNLYADSENKNSTPTGKDLVNKTLFVLGNITWNDFTSNGKKTISLDRVPISMKLFMEFWIEKVVKRQRKSYPLNQFIKDVMTNLVKAVFTNKCRIHGEPLNNLTCNLEHVSVNPDISGDPKINLIPSMAIGDVDEGLFNALSPISSPTRILLTRPTKAQILKAAARAESDAPPIPNFAELASSNSSVRKRAQRQQKRRARHEKRPFHQLNTVELIYVYATNDKPDHLQGNRKKDVDAGVVHLEVGNPNSPLKQVSFNKSDQPFYLEAKGETNDLKDNSLELSEPYNLDLSFYGLTYPRPGQHFYLKLKNFGDPRTKRSRGTTLLAGNYSVQASPSRRLGIGGYYMMNKIEHNFRAEGGRTYWETMTQALWTTFGDRKAENNRTLSNTPDPFSNPADYGTGAMLMAGNAEHSTVLRNIDRRLSEAGITARGSLAPGRASEVLPEDIQKYTGNTNKQKQLAELRVQQIRYRSEREEGILGTMPDSTSTKYKFKSFGEHLAETREEAREKPVLSTEDITSNIEFTAAERAANAAAEAKEAEKRRAEVHADADKLTESAPAKANTQSSQATGVKAGMGPGIGF